MYKTDKLKLMYNHLLYIEMYFHSFEFSLVMNFLIKNNLTFAFNGYIQSLTAEMVHSTILRAGCYQRNWINYKLFFLSKAELKIILCVEDQNKVFNLTLIFI